MNAGAQMFVISIGHWGPFNVSGSWNTRRGTSKAVTAAWIGDNYQIAMHQGREEAVVGSELLI